MCVRMCRTGPISDRHSDKGNFSCLNVRKKNEKEKKDRFIIYNDFSLFLSHSHSYSGLGHIDPFSLSNLSF
jgi:hypothetical protein